MSLDRREFLKLCTGTVAGLGVSQMVHPAVVHALEKAAAGKPPVLWIQGQGCTGCSVSILNSVHPTIADVLLKVISLEFHPTVMAGEGELAMEHMMQVAEEYAGKFFLVVEGSIPTAADGKYCIIGEIGHHEISMMEAMEKLGSKAAAAIAVGQCSAYGGIPAAQGSETDAKNVAEFFKDKGIGTPVVNIPGCPPHPDWMVGSLAFALEHGLQATVDILDDYGRPTPFFGKNIHDNCPYLPMFNEGMYSETFTEPVKCRYELGCKGPYAYSDCYKRIWNSGLNWCAQNSVCIGCVEPNWPDEFSPFYVAF